MNDEDINEALDDDSFDFSEIDDNIGDPDFISGDILDGIFLIDNSDFEREMNQIYKMDYIDIIIILIFLHFRYLYNNIPIYINIINILRIRNYF